MVEGGCVKPQAELGWAWHQSHIGVSSSCKAYEGFNSLDNFPTRKLVSYSYSRFNTVIQTKLAFRVFSNRTATNQKINYIFVMIKTQFHTEYPKCVLETKSIF